MDSKQINEWARAAVWRMLERIALAITRPKQ